MHKIYPASGGPVVALDGISLEVRSGEMVALVGPSGCGKTTLLNLVACVDRPTTGRVIVDGADTASLDDDALTALRRDRVGTVYQFFNLLPALTLEANVALPLVLQRVPPKEIAQRVREALAAVDLSAKARAFPAEVSGGQLQRAAVARATIHRPAIVLADEPTGNLDSRSGEIVLRLLRGLADGGQAVLLATHSTELANACDRTIAMRDGRIA